VRQSRNWVIFRDRKTRGCVYLVMVMKRMFIKCLSHKILSHKRNSLVIRESINSNGNSGPKFIPPFGGRMSQAYVSRDLLGVFR